MKNKINYFLVFIIFTTLLIISYFYYNSNSNSEFFNTATSPGTLESCDNQDSYELSDNYSHYKNYYKGYPTGAWYGYSPINYYYGWPMHSVKYKHKTKKYYY